MPRPYTSIIVPATAGDIWDLVRDFNGLPGWHPAIARSEIEDGGHAGVVGCVRHLTLADGSVMREKLVDLDDADRSYTYESLVDPHPVRNYRATVRVRPVTDTGQAFVEWYSFFEADAADEAELARTYAEDVYGTGVAGLRARFGG